MPNCFRAKSWFWNLDYVLLFFWNATSKNVSHIFWILKNVKNVLSNTVSSMIFYPTVTLNLDLWPSQSDIFISRVSRNPAQEISRTHFNKVPGGFLHWSSLLSITTWHTNTCIVSIYNTVNKTAQKMVKWQFLGFNDVTRFGSVIGILSYFSWQLHFPGASTKFQEISMISRSCSHPAFSVPKC